MIVATITGWLDRLQRVRKSGKGYMALCPAHADKNPSLMVTEGAGRKVLVTCFAGCTFEAIRDALWPQGASTEPSTPTQRRGGAEMGNPQSPPRALPDGPNDTISKYHYADGSVAFASVRHQPTGKAKRFSQWTPADGGLWFDRNPLRTLPLYRLPQIADAEKVVIVEGEKCVHAVLDAWPNMAVTTFAGGCGSWRKTDWAPLARKEVSIWADADDDAPPDKPTANSRPGQTAALEIAAHLSTWGCRVRVALPEPDGGSDIADWLAVGKGHAKAVLDGLLRDYEPEPQLEPAPEPENEPGYEDHLKKNDHYKIIGLVGEAVAIRTQDGQVLYRAREKMLRKDTLGAICPDQTWWVSLLGGEPLTNANAFNLGSSLLKIALKEGQKDMSQTYGRGAVRLPGGRIVYHLGDRLLENGHEDGSLDDDDIVWTSDSRIELSPDATEGQCKAIAEAVMRYRWRNDMDGKRFLGWMVTAIVGGALEWRPHIQLTAPSGQGKSWLLRQVLSVLMGPLLTQIVDASPAALARLTGHASLPFSFDEAEPSAQWILELLLLMRASSGGEGLRVRVDMQTGGVQTQRPRFSALLSNVSAPDMSRADASRVVNVSLGAEVEDWPTVEESILTAMTHADKVRSRIIRETAPIARRVGALAREMQSLGMDSREALASAALTAGWHWWGIDETDVYSNDDHNRDRHDAADCLTAIMSLTLRDPGGAGKTLAKAISSDALVVADLYGIRYSGLEGLMVQYGHRGLSGGLKGTPWEKAELRSTLMQLDGATLTNPLRIGNQRMRCVNIPYATLLKAGVEIGDETE